MISLALLKELRRLISGLQAGRGNYDVVIPLLVMPISNVLFVFSFFLEPLLWILDRLVRFDVADMRPSLVAPAALLSSNISRESCIMILAIY